MAKLLQLSLLNDDWIEWWSVTLNAIVDSRKNLLFMFFSECQLITAIHNWTLDRLKICAKPSLYHVEVPACWYLFLFFPTIWMATPQITTWPKTGNTPHQYHVTVNSMHQTIRHNDQLGQRHFDKCHEHTKKNLFNKRIIIKHFD